MDVPETLRCLFSARATTQNETVTVEIPAREVERGEVTPGEVYRVAILSPVEDESEIKAGPADSRPEAASARAPNAETPPISEGEERTVEIEGTGDQGDGIARVERGFVVIIPETSEGERVSIEITDVRQTVAFAEVLSRQPFYE
jgi:predicted RNA-binding protein with TRAM domain